MSAQGQLFVPANLPDVCRHKHGGNCNSEAANARLHEHKPTLRERVRIWVEGCGSRGATLSETCKALDKQPHQLSGRFTELLWHERTIKLAGTTRLNDRGNAEAVYVSVGQCPVCGKKVA